MFEAAFMLKLSVGVSVMLSNTADADNVVVVFIDVGSIAQLRYRVDVGTRILVRDDSVIVLLVQVVLASNVVVK